MAYPTFTLEPYALAALLSVKEHLNIKESETGQDNVLTRMINASSQMIENYLDRKVLSRSYTEYYDGRKNDRILLRNWPSTAVAELWDDPASEFTDAANQFDTSEFKIDGEGDSAAGVVLLSGLKFGGGARSIKAVYTAGYATVPYIVQEACLLHVEYMFDMRSDRRIGVQTKGKNQESTTFLGTLPQFVMDMLTPYMRIEFPLAYQGVQNS